MSHVTCPKCGSRDHTQGYGLAAGPMGAYTFCNACDSLLEFMPDSTYTDEERALALDGLDKHMIAAFGAENWNKERHCLIDKWYNQEPPNGNA